MDQNGKSTNGMNGLGETYHGQDEAEVELTYQAHRSEPGDLSLLNSLVERYAGEVERLAGALVALSDYPLSLESATQSVVIRTFAYAIRHTDRFRGKASLRNWLLGITIRQAAQYGRENRRRESTGQGEVVHHGGSPVNWERVDSLPEKLRLALILRYTCGLAVEDIGETLGVRFKQVQDWLASGRRKLLPEQSSSHRAEELEAYLDGLLAENLAKRNELESHLPECQECDTYLVRLRELDQQLREGLQERWQLRMLSSQENGLLAQMIEESLPAENKWQLPKGLLRQVVWIVGLMALFVAAVFTIIAKQPEEKDFLPRPSVMPTVLPMIEPVQIPDQLSAGIDQGVPSSSFTGITYDMSEDAGLFVLVTTSYELGYTDFTTITQKIHWYDRRNGTMDVISNSHEGMEGGSWINSHPSLSADGRFLAFSQTGSPERGSNNGSMSFCETPLGTSCTDIYIYDRQSGTSEKITRGLDGAPADGLSLAPSISADGRWVAFWSMASNLVEGDGEPCFTDSANCLDIFLYDRQEGEYTRIPVGATISMQSIGPNLISISADGGLVGFTVQMDDLLADQLDLQYERQAVLYDRENGSYELVNNAPDGTPGDGASFGAVLSSDGRFVAFGSLASNLVDGDTNGSFDVFVLDRQNDAIERVSVNSFGEEGNGDSGTFSGGEGFYSIDISDDGRFVTFLSEATNFSSSALCDADAQEICNGVFLHDRQSGTSEVIHTMQNGHFYMFLNVSNNGRWVSYTDIMQDCSSYQSGCLETVLYDRQRGWTSQVSGDLFQPALAEWRRGQPIEAQQEQIDALAVSQDGKYLAAAYGDNSIAMWDFAQRRWVRTMQVKTGGPITSLAFDPAGEWLAAGTLDGVVKIWQVNGRSLYELDGHPGRVHTVLFSPDSNELFAGTPSEVWVWRKGEGKLILAYKLEYSSTVNSIALSPSGNLLAAANSDRTVWLQLLPSGSLIARLGGQENLPVSVAFSPDGSLLAARALSGEVNLWRVDWKGFGALETEFVTGIKGTNWFGNLVFSPDGRYLASGSYYQGVNLWNVITEKLVVLYTPESSQGIVRAVAFTTDGSTILAGSFGELASWNTRLTVVKPRYFQRYSGDDFSRLSSADGPLADDWPESLRLVGEEGSHLDLYQADELLPFDLLVPTRLPEQVHFMEAKLLADGGVALRYEVEDLSGISADLYVLEHPVVSGETFLPIPEGALVEEVGRGAFYAEYLAGDWRQAEAQTEGDTPLESWVWDQSLHVQRLRWHYEGLAVSIFYQQRTPETQLESVYSLEAPMVMGEVQSDFGLDKDDLVQVALGVEALPGYIPSVKLYISYQIQEGDTCYGIAGNFGTSLEELVEVNPTIGDCSLIRTGDVLHVPLNDLRLDMEKADLDCDGRDERVQVTPALGTPGQSLVYSVFLQSISDMGVYQDAWQISSKSEQTGYLSYPLLIELGTCEYFIAVRGEGGERAGLRVYRWINEQMELVLGEGTRLLASDAGDDTLTVFEQVVDPVSGVCQAWEVTYRWDGSKLLEVERIISACGS